MLIGSETHIALEAAQILVGDPGAELAAVLVDAAGGGRLARYAQEHGVPVSPAERIRTDGASFAATSPATG